MEAITESKALVIPRGESRTLEFIRGSESHIGGGQLPAVIELEEDSRLALTVGILPGTPSENLVTEIVLKGKGADCSIKGFIIGKGEDRSSVTVTLRHRAGGCTSNQQFRIIASESSRCGFYGKIIVDPDAQKTEAYQENHNLLLSENATIGTMPQLEIYADDVKCSHGATIGKLNEDELFYMRSRGISEDEAKELLLKAFMLPMTDNIHEGDDKESLINEIIACL